MPWLRVDDNLALHPKVLQAGNAAMGMWVRAGSWAAQQLTDGFVPDEVVVLLGGHSAGRRLVAAGLWVRGTDGYWFHQWDERQPTREKVERDRKAASIRKDRWRERQENAVPDAVPNGEGAATPTRPDPTRPQRPSAVTEVMSSTVRNARGAA